MTDPRVLSIISFIFALLAAYSLYTGVRQLRDAHRQGHPIRWYKNLSLLTGIEYALLTFVFILRTATAQNAIAPGMQYLVGPLYLVLLIPAAVVAGFVIRRVILNMRATGQASRVPPKSPAISATVAQTSTNLEERVLSKQEREEQSQRQRERRKKAAAARRRQAGKA